MQVLDEGRLTDNKGRLADFKNIIIIMTSNLGSHVIEQSIEDLGHNQTALEKAKLDIMGLLKQSVRPEFLNRIDDIIMFEPLTEVDLKRIVALQLKSVQKLLGQQGITLDATPEAQAWLAERGFDPQFGARPVKRVIQREVLNALSKSILSGALQTDSIILIDCFDNELVFRNEKDLVKA